MTTPFVSFTADQQAVISREIKAAFSALSTLLDWVENGNLSEEMRDNMPSLIQSQLAKVNETLGVTGGETDRQKEIRQSIVQQYTQEIAQLKQALEQQDSIASIPANVKRVFDKLKRWWKIEGFNYMSDEYVVSSGVVRVSLGFMLHSFANKYSDTPVTDEAKQQTKLDYLLAQGYQFAPSDDSDMNLLDNDHNRALLRGLIKTALPSAKIFSVENHLRRTGSDEHFIIRRLDITVFDMADIENLVIPEREYANNEDNY